jgi:tRNA pseudouridine38-40 synthase
VRRTYRVVLAYDGAAFDGYARQPDRPSVEGSLRSALAPLVGRVPKIAVAGRTDKGVGATGQVVSFHAYSPLDPARVTRVIDREVPGAIAALDVAEMPRWFHAAFSAKARRYTYFVESDLDPAPIDRLLAALIGRRDFTAFARDTPPNKTTVRTLYDARVRRDGTRLRFDYGADGFLRRQVRVLTATALEAAAEGAPDDELVRIASTLDRRNTAVPLPPAGLFLTRVIY